MMCRKELHEMTPENTIDRRSWGKGLACLECRRAANRRSKAKTREADGTEPERLAPVPVGHRVVGWLLLDRDGITAGTFERLTDFVDAHSKAHIYVGPPAGYRLQRITEPRNAA